MDTPAASPRPILVSIVAIEFALAPLSYISLAARIGPAGAYLFGLHVPVLVMRIYGFVSAPAWLYFAWGFWKLDRRALYVYLCWTVCDYLAWNLNLPHMGAVFSNWIPSLITAQPDPSGQILHAQIGSVVGPVCNIAVALWYRKRFLFRPTPQVSPIP